MGLGEAIDGFVVTRGSVQYGNRTGSNAKSVPLPVTCEVAISL